MASPSPASNEKPAPKLSDRARTATDQDSLGRSRWLRLRIRRAPEGVGDRLSHLPAGSSRSLSNVPVAVIASVSPVLSASRVTKGHVRLVMK